MLKPFRVPYEYAIFVLAVLCGVYAYYPALVDRYIIADDARITIYWAYRFQDAALFQNDLITRYAENYSPWGYNFLFFLFSKLGDPILAGHTAAIILLGIGAVYMFKFVRSFAGEFAGILSAVCFMMSPVVLSKMAGGMPRVFAWPLLLIFLYALIHRRETGVGVVLALQCLFYPMIFLLSFFTYAMSFLKWPPRGFFIDTTRRRWVIFIVTAVACASILVGRHVIFNDPQIGRTYTKAELIESPESRVFGRVGPLLPQKPFFWQLGNDLRTDSAHLDMLRWALPGSDTSGSLWHWGLLLILLAFLAYEAYQKRLRFPPELAYLLTASVIMFHVANAVMLKLFFPYRYLNYSIPLLVIIMSGVAVARVIEKVHLAPARRTLQVLALALVPVFVLPLNRSGYLMDARPNQEWLEYLGALPKDAHIAAHPKLADDIPTFAKRKVLVNYEMSLPFYNKVWPVLQQRTFDFFSAYYAEHPLHLYAFCKKYDIDYLVVDLRHFHPLYLQQGRFYFEPFNYVTRQLVKERKDFVLRYIPEEERLFQSGSVFVMEPEALLRLLERGQ